MSRIATAGAPCPSGWSGMQVEAGPYTLGGHDIDVLVSAIGRCYTVDMEMRAAADSGTTDE
jgi:hypothetical protein